MHVMVSGVKLTLYYLKMTVLWDIAPCGLIDVDRCFTGAPLKRVSINRLQGVT